MSWNIAAVHAAPKDSVIGEQGLLVTINEVGSYKESQPGAQKAWKKLDLKCGDQTGTIDVAWWNPLVRDPNALIGKTVWICAKEYNSKLTGAYVGEYNGTKQVAVRGDRMSHWENGQIIQWPTQGQQPPGAPPGQQNLPQAAPTAAPPAAPPMAPPAATAAPGPPLAAPVPAVNPGVASGTTTWGNRQVNPVSGAAEAVALHSELLPLIADAYSRLFNLGDPAVVDAIQGTATSFMIAYFDGKLTRDQLPQVAPQAPTGSMPE
jgi:hypothetical protein